MLRGKPCAPHLRLPSRLGTDRRSPSLGGRRHAGADTSLRACRYFKSVGAAFPCGTSTMVPALFLPLLVSHVDRYLRLRRRKRKDARCHVVRRENPSFDPPGNCVSAFTQKSVVIEHTLAKTNNELGAPSRPSSFVQVLWISQVFRACANFVCVQATRTVLSRNPFLAPLESFEATRLHSPPKKNVPLGSIPAIGAYFWWLLFGTGAYFLHQFDKDLLPLASGR